MTFPSDPQAHLLMPPSRDAWLADAEMTACGRRAVELRRAGDIVVRSQGEMRPLRVNMLGQLFRPCEVCLASWPEGEDVPI